MELKYLMKCGCIAQGCTGKDSKPVCVIHECTEIADEVPDLTGRMARCSCGKKVPSKYTLPFFVSQPKYKYDSYYCGHWGWD